MCAALRLEQGIPCFIVASLVGSCLMHIATCRCALSHRSTYILFLVYPRTCETIVNAFLCHKLKDGRQYLLQDFNVLCDRPYRALMFPAASTALLVYATGVPATFFWRLRMHKVRLSRLSPSAVCSVRLSWMPKCKHTPDAIACNWGISCVTKDVLQAPAPKWQLGFLYRDYEEKFYFFESVDRADALLERLHPVRADVMLPAPCSPPPELRSFAHVVHRAALQ